MNRRLALAFSAIAYGLLGSHLLPANPAEPSAHIAPAQAVAPQQKPIATPSEALAEDGANTGDAEAGPAHAEALREPEIPVETQGATPAVHESKAPHTVREANIRTELEESILRLGDSLMQRKDADTATLAYTQIARDSDDPNRAAQAFLGLARAYRSKHELVKAAAVYERLVRDYPDNPDNPLALLELGRTMRALGAPQRAISRFYSVLHSTLRISGDSERYQQIARTAQFEIAETHFLTGNFTEATRFFTRLDLLDLAPEDRARARFKAAVSLKLDGKPERAISGFVQFIEIYPDAADSAEARYQLAGLLQSASRPDDALQVTLDLLRHAKASDDENGRWRYWQRRTGNQLANDFFLRGNYQDAFTIYQSLSALDDEPIWTWPVFYQMGLCEERLMQDKQAAGIYQKLVDTKLAADASPTLQKLQEMAQWRLSQLLWTGKTRNKLRHLVDPASTPEPEPSRR